MAQQAEPPPIDPEALAHARAVLPPEGLLDIVVETFAALGDPTRARILYALGRLGGADAAAALRSALASEEDGAVKAEIEAALAEP